MSISAAGDRRSQRGSSVSRRAVFLGAAALVTPVSAPARADAPDEQALLAELRGSFTLRGKPVPPEIFRDIGDGNLADSETIWVTVDLGAAVGSNLYADDIRIEGAWRKQARGARRGEAEETAYRYVGVAANGLLVVVASYSGGGSGVFYTLHILDLATARAFDFDGSVRTRLNLTVLRSIPLGDRWDGEVAVSGDDIHVITRRGGPVGGPAAPGMFRAARP